MSRTKGALNKKHRPVLFKRKRGRPRKVVEPLPPVPEQISNLTTKKFIGYCPKCRFMICKGDKISKFIFQCPSCGKRARIKTLKKDTGTEKKYANQKEYIEAAVNTQYHDMPPMHEKGIDPKHLKVIE